MASSPGSGEILAAEPDGVIVSGPDGVILYANPEAERLSGHSPLVGRSIEDLIPVDLRAVHRRHRAVYFDTPAPRSMGGGGARPALRRRSAELLEVEVRLSPIPLAGGTGVVATIRPSEAAGEGATMREVSIRRPDARRLLELANDAILVRDAATGTITFWNQGAVELYGYPRSEAVGRITHDLLRTVFPASPAEVDASLADTGSWQGELVHRRRDGSTVIVSSRQLLTRGSDQSPVIFEINRDVTDERRSHDRLVAVAEVAQTILSGGSDDDLLEIVARRARTLSGSTTAAIALVEEGGPLRVGVVAGEDHDLAVGVTVGAEVVAALGTGQAAPVSGPVAEQPGPTSAGPRLAVPLVTAAEALGVLILARGAGAEAFGEVDVQTVHLYALTATAALEYARARRLLDQVTLIEDRERIARDLHDGAIQALFAVGMRLQQTVLRVGDAAIRQRLEEDVASIDAVIRDLRGYIFALRPGILRDLGLGEALRRLTSQFEAESGVTTVLEVEPAAAGAMAEWSADILQMVGEALSNVRKHARAATCRVSLRSEEGGVVLRVEDDGGGFDPASVSGAGHGLRNFRERAERIGAELTITSPPDGGTLVSVAMPGR